MSTNRPFELIDPDVLDALREDKAAVIQDDIGRAVTDFLNANT